MEYLTGNNWCVKGNTISRSLMDFYVDIKQIAAKDHIVSLLSVYKDGCEFFFSFDNLEEAISFTQEEVAYSHSIKEVNEKYVDKYIKGKQKTYNNP